MKKPFKTEKQIVAPVYPGGKKALDAFVKENLVYPEDAIKNNIEGSVSIDYNVDVFGNVIQAKIKHGLGFGCDEEALRLTRLIKYPKKKYQGLHVVFHMSIVIHFRLKPGAIPQPATQPQFQMQINYQIVSKPESSDNSNIYTISLS
jgi:TonB family protein